jgi:hypothetical protein
MTQILKRRATVLLCVLAVAVAFSFYYVRTHPLVFNESFLEHAHCIKAATLSLRIYADDHHGRFPFHTNGYADALLLVADAWLPSFTGPSYNAAVLERARQTGQHVPESACGRVYVQGLTDEDSPNIALLFDKVPSPGDHRHLFSRLHAPLVREVGMLDGSMRTIKESVWPAFAKQQIELLVAAGITREQAQMYYSEKAKR